ncbi:hypothetical protein LIER_09626 [Lithospermum erythrorhizon]|uniref:RNase H type-1 domain-containing protein n=1 Tax=Lithospermum erythrorhizon TaxID=34254 RepID=A0AAV3PIB8_LITER
MEPPSEYKDIQKLTGCLAALNGVNMEYALRFTFSTTNNEAKYEALVAGLSIVKALGINSIWVKGNSKLVIDQARGTCEVKHDPLRKYLAQAMQLAKKFEQVVLEHIPRSMNEEADHLSRLGTTYYDELPKGVCVEIRDKPAYEECLSLPILQEPEDWRTPIARYLTNGQPPESLTEAQKIRNRSFKFYMYDEELYKKSWDWPLLRCVSDEDILKILAEVHQGWCGSHIGGRSLAVKIKRIGY